MAVDMAPRVERMAPENSRREAEVWTAGTQLLWEALYARSLF